MLSLTMKNSPLVHLRNTLHYKISQDAYFLLIEIDLRYDIKYKKKQLNSEDEYSKGYKVLMKCNIHLKTMFHFHAFIATS